MKKWFFSKNGKITGPFTEVEAKEFLLSDGNCYGWHPSFTQWKPASSIPEFAAFVPAVTPPAEIPQALIAEFAAKDKALQAKILSMEESVISTKAYLLEFEQEITNYKKLTNNLNDEVKNNISPFENKYNSLQNSFDELVSALSIAKTEVNEAVTEFNQRVNKRLAESGTDTKAVTAAPVAKDAAVSSAALSVDNVSAISDQIQKALAESMMSAVEDVNNSELTAKKSLDPVAVAPKKAKAKIDKIEFSEDIAEDTQSQAEEKAAGLSGVSNIFKSVFKGDPKTPPKKSETPDDADQLVKSTNANSNDKKATDKKEEVVETEDEKEARMRRRRRRTHYIAS
ncbi:MULTISPECIES: DUF4339 domain-containing protein [unclassified Shewanella]|uniref:DUF4339 domain-containing protein n=2 Tax=Shewanella TaxID=22 RepID=UPI000C815156|nr:DUF4339 domain-containing protein [Shewanella sp. 10N.286.48.B5]PMH86782.1 hypothetical protein BCU57_09680 [Shewanella sp. 10N.286.48.B5]